MKTIQFKRGFILVVLLVHSLAIADDSIAESITTESGQEVQLRAGVGKEKITPPAGIPFLGHAYRVSEGVHDDLWAKVLVLEKGGTTAAIVALDLACPMPGGPPPLRPSAVAYNACGRTSSTLCCTTTSVVQAAQVERKPGKEKKTGEKKKMGHPRLYFTEKDIPRIRALVKKAPYSQHYAGTRRLAMEYVNVPYGSTERPGWYPEKHGGTFDAYHDGAWSICRYMTNMAVVYLMDGDKRMGQRAKEWLLAICDLPYWTIKSFRDKGEPSYLRSAPYYLNVAETYDLVRPLLTEAEARRVRDGMVRNGLKAVYDHAMRGDCHYSQPYDSNWIGVIVGSAGLLELVIDGEQVSDPMRDEYVAKIREIFDTHMNTYGVDGGYIEGLGYLHYELDCGAARYLLALEHVKGITYCENVRNTPQFVAFARFPFDFPPCPRAKYYCLSFGDGSAIPSWDGPHGTTLAFLSSYTREPVAQWLLNDHIRCGAVMGDFHHCPRLWHNTDLAAEPPQKTSRHFRTIGCVYSRCTWDYNKDVCVVSRSAPEPCPHYRSSHLHADQNTFFVMAYGEPVIVEAGIQDYSSKYGNTKVKPNDYHLTALGHNTILLDMDRYSQVRQQGKGAKVTGFLGSGHCDVWTGSAANAYKGKLNRFDRTFVHMKPGYLVICDVLESSGPGYQYDSLLHAHSFGRGERCITTEGNTVTVRSMNAGVVVDIIEPRNPGFNRNGPFPTLGLQHNKHRDFDTYWISFHPKAKSKDAMLLSVYQPFRSKPAGLAKVERIGTASVLGVRVKAKEWTDILLFSPSRSGVSGEKVSSDGEFAAVRTDSKAKVTRIAVQNGKRVSYNGKTWFSSSKRVSFTADFSSRSGDMACGLGDMPEGGARLRVGIPSGRKVREVFLDGEKVEFSVQGGDLSFTVTRGGELVVKVSQ